jgi:hypothetical protein
MPFFPISATQGVQQGNLEGMPRDPAQGMRQRVALLLEAGQLILGDRCWWGWRRPTRWLIVPLLRLVCYDSTRPISPGASCVGNPQTVRPAVTLLRWSTAQTSRSG